jgi:hypothetical protein
MEISLRHKAHTIWHIQRAKRLVRDHIGSGAQCLVSVRETICTDPGCEGPMTEIRIVTLGFRETRALIHKRTAEIAIADVAGVL